jgi:predicted metal-dependent hydrolase
MVSGQLEHVPRRACDWLRAEAKRELSTMVRQAAERLGRPVARISIRDPRSRWGSCNRNGVICLSWRLALAPTPVARYVVAHEVAHLRHLNHSAAFWRTVATLVDGVEEARAWLRAHGASLHRFGRIER